MQERSKKFYGQDLYCCSIVVIDIYQTPLQNGKQAEIFQKNETSVHMMLYFEWYADMFKVNSISSA